MIDKEEEYRSDKQKALAAAAGTRRVHCVRLFIWRFDMATALPTDRVLKVSPFPSPRVEAEPVSLAGLVKGKTSVLHLYTG